MSKRLIALPIALAVVLAMSAGASGQTGLELSPYCGPYGGETIEVPDGDIETLWFHIVEPGLWHVGAVPPLSWEMVSGTNIFVEVLDLDVMPSTEYTGSTWYPYGTIKVTGEYCTTVAITISLTVQPPLGTITSNTIYKHIIPEPSTMLVLGVGLGGVLLRRRRRR